MGGPQPPCTDFGESRRNRENRGEITGGLFYFCKMNFSDETILISVDSLMEDRSVNTGFM